jgi:uncharacterized protein
MLLSLLILLVAMQVLLPLLLHTQRHRLIFFPSPEPPEQGLPLLARRVEARLVSIRRPDGRELAAYDARPLGVVDDGPVVLFCHGNAGNIAWRASTLAWFVEGTGARTLLFDYSGYGGNAGEPSEEEVYKDGFAAYEYLLGQGVEPRRIVLYGESLGVAVALAIAAERPVAGVVAQSGFSSLASMARSLYPWLPLSAVLARGAFTNNRRLAGLSVPALIVHGTADEIIPFSEAQKLAAAAPAGSELLAIEGAGHNDLFEVAGEPYLRRLGERLRQQVKA